jgi:uncharacterized protein DUF4338/transposase Tn5 family protein/transposase-like protein
VIVCGREFDSDLIARLNQTAAGLSRRALSLQLCQWLDWKGPSGRWQTLNARIALNRLQKAGLLQLAQPAKSFLHSGRSAPAPEMTRPEIGGDLAEVKPVELELVGSPHRQASHQCRALLRKFHPLGDRLCGAQLRYLIRCPKGILGVICFSAAARRLRARDQWIGWSETARRENLHYVVNNSRLVIRSDLSVRHLASHVLAKAARQLPLDWQKRYGYRPLLLETFVDKSRYEGTCYRASNWIELDQPSTGRGRNDPKRQHLKTPKGIFLYPLSQEAPAQLRQLPEKLRLAQVPGPSRPKAEPEDWAQEELGRAQLGDQRLRKRLCVVARDFYARPQSNIPQSCGGDRAKTKAMYRLFDHPRVTMEAVLQCHYEATAQRLAKEKLVLVAQDTSFLNYSTHPATENLGLIGSTAQGLIGLVMHDTMAFNLEGTPLGLLDVQCWARDPEQFGKKHQRHQLAFADKESAKWVRSLEAVAKVQSQCPQTQLVSIGDRESDIYEVFVWAKAQAGRPQLLIRAEQNRRLRQEHGYLWEQLAAQPLAGTQGLKVPRRSNRAARVAQLEVRFSAVTLRAPNTRAKLPDVGLWAVWAREVGAPEGVEPVEWMLLTTLPVESFEQAAQQIRWYTQRWGIEVFHKTLKSGCKIETRQLGSADRIEGCLAIDLVVAWRIFHLTKLGRETPNVPCTVYFEEIEWQALVGFMTKNPIPPREPPTLREAIRMIASLGGFLGRKGDGEPGVQTIWLGLQRHDDIVEAWKVFSALLSPTVSSNPTYG